MRRSACSATDVALPDSSLGMRATHTPFLVAASMSTVSSPTPVLLDEAEFPLPDEVLVYPGDKRDNHVCFSDVCAELFLGECQDIVVRQEGGKLPAGNGESLAAEEDFHRYLIGTPG